MSRVITPATRPRVPERRRDESIGRSLPIRDFERLVLAIGHSSIGCRRCCCSRSRRRTRQETSCRSRSWSSCRRCPPDRGGRGAEPAILVPPPYFPLVRYHGVFAARSSWRALVTPKPPHGLASPKKPKPCGERDAETVALGAAPPLRSPPPASSAPPTRRGETPPNAPLSQRPRLPRPLRARRSRKPYPSPRATPRSSRSSTGIDQRPPFLRAFHSTGVSTKSGQPHVRYHPRSWSRKWMEVGVVAPRARQQPTLRSRRRPSSNLLLTVEEISGSLWV